MTMTMAMMTMVIMIVCDDGGDDDDEEEDVRLPSKPCSNIHPNFRSPNLGQQRIKNKRCRPWVI